MLPNFSQYLSSGISLSPSVMVIEDSSPFQAEENVIDFPSDCKIAAFISGHLVSVKKMY